MCDAHDRMMTLLTNTDRQALKPGKDAGPAVGAYMEVIMPKARAPIPYYGGKSLLTPKLLRLFPAHHTYVEPFAGSGVVLLAKPAGKVEVYNDLNSGLVALYSVIRDHDKVQRLLWLCHNAPSSREMFSDYVQTWQEPADEVERAFRWFYVARHSFSGIWGQSWGFSVSANARGMAQPCSSWLSALDLLASVSRRMRHVQIEHVDFRRVIRIYDTPQTLFYVDPPYVMSTRSGGVGYEHELSDQDHLDLVQQLLTVEGMVVLSGYATDLYKPLEDAGWHRHEFQQPCLAVGRTRAAKRAGALKDQVRTECVWVSPRAQAAPRMEVPE